MCQCQTLIEEVGDDDDLPIARHFSVCCEVGAVLHAARQGRLETYLWTDEDDGVRKDHDSDDDELELDPQTGQVCSCVCDTVSQKEQVGRHVDVSECFKQDLNLRANCAISGVLGADVREVRTYTLADLDEGHV